MPPSGGLRSATTTVAPSRSSPRAIAAPIPCAPPVTIATFPSRAPLTRPAASPTLQHSVARPSADRRERGRHHDPVPLRVEEGLEPGEEGLPARVGLEARAALLALGVAGVAPQADDRGQLADVDREPAEQVAEVLLLEGDALVLVQLHDLGQLARDDVVGALLDDHAADSTSGTLRGRAVPGPQLSSWDSCGSKVTQKSRSGARHVRISTVRSSTGGGWTGISLPTLGGELRNGPGRRCGPGSRARPWRSTSARATPRCRTSIPRGRCRTPSRRRTAPPPSR